MTCREFAEFLGRYLAGELLEPERRTFDAHLAICPDCVAFLVSYRETLRRGRWAHAGDDGPPEDAPEDLVRAILSARETVL